MSLGITYPILDKYTPCPSKILQLEVADCIRSCVYQKHPDGNECIYPGDILVVKKIYKYHVEACIPGGTNFTLGTDDFNLLHDKLKVGVGSWVIPAVDKENGCVSLKKGTIVRVVAILDYCIIVEDKFNNRFTLNFGEYDRAPEKHPISHGISESSVPAKLDDNKFKEENTMSMSNELNKLFGAVSPGMCRISMSGGIAVKTSSGYKTYNMKTGRLTNCDNFAFDLGTEWFFCLPTNHVKTGDIILINGKPCCVKKATKEELTVINYETNTVDTVLPERHMFMGNMYFYSKITSPFGNPTKKGGGGMKRLMKYMMMSEMLKGGMADMMGGLTPSNGQQAQMNGMKSMMLMAMMGGGGFGDFFEGIFEDEDDDEGLGGMFGELFGEGEGDDDDDEGEEPVAAAAPKPARKTGTRKTGTKAKEEANQ